MIETEIDGKVVIVTGAAAGIGRATAHRFAAEGAKVAGWDVQGDAAAFAAEMAEAGGEGVLMRVDVTDSAAVNAAVEEVAAQWGGVDILINNAGILRDSMLVKYKDGAVQSVMNDEQFDAVLDVNLRGVFVCARAVAPKMIDRGGGVILNASSVVGLYGNFGQTNYIASKAGVIGMTKVWARELGRHGIRVNAVAPGFIATEILAAMPQKVLDSMTSRTPLGRMGKPEEIAEAYVWLASKSASFVTGAVLSVDGGVVTGT